MTFFDGDYLAMARRDFGDWVEVGWYETPEAARAAIGHWHHAQVYTLTTQEIPPAWATEQHCITFAGGRRAGTVQRRDDDFPFPLTQRG